MVCNSNNSPGFSMICSSFLGSILIGKVNDFRKESLLFFIYILFCIRLFYHQKDYDYITEKEVTIDVTVINNSENQNFVTFDIKDSESIYNLNYINGYFYEKNIDIEEGDNLKIKGILKINDKNNFIITSCIILEYLNNDKIYEIKNFLSKRIDHILLKISNSEKIYSFLNAVLLGNKEYFSKDIIKKYKISGTMHLFAVSGIHIGFIYIIFSFVIGFVIRNKYFKEFIIIFFLLLYLELINYPPSAQRATIMICMYQSTKLLNKEKNLLSNLMWSGLLILFIEPDQLLDLGFQLSFTVLFAITIISNNLSHNFENITKNYLYQSFITSYAAFCGSCLLLLDYFSIIVPGSILINMIIIPLFFIFMIFLFLVLFISNFIELTFLYKILQDSIFLIDIIIDLFTKQNVSYFYCNFKEINQSVHLIFPFTYFFYRFYFSNIYLNLLILMILPVVSLLFFLNCF